MLKLQIELLSDLCAGSGLARPAEVDREVVFDDSGLPWLPSRRLKGLLKDAYDEIRLNLPGHNLPDGSNLFGTIGAEQPGSLRLRNAYLQNHARLSDWASSFVAGHVGIDRRKAVIDAFSSIRRQTAIDRKTGAPKQDTLRSTRVLRAGLVFEAAIDGHPSAVDLWTLALSAAALRSMGSSRWRGLGSVRCRLLEEKVDWTAAALKGLSDTAFRPAPLERRTSDEVAGPAPRMDAARLLFQLTLEEPAIFPQLRGDPNTVATADYIPGSNIHGALAQRFLRRIANRPNDDFRAIFTSARVSFGDATPGDRIPHSIRQHKSDLALTDLSGGEAENVRRRHGWMEWSQFESGRLQAIPVRTELHYHHARAKDKRYERAIGAEKAASPEDGGAFFQYECLTRGQQFSGEIRGEPELLNRISSLVSNGEVLDLGRSRTAQYGGRAVWRWLPPLQDLPESDAVTDAITVIALSPVISVNENGHPVPRFPVEELALELGISTSFSNQLVLTEFCRSEWQGGYLSHQRLPRLQVPAWSAGSVLVLCAPQGSPIPVSRIRRAELRSYGLRQEQGFGRVRILPRAQVATGFLEEYVKPVTVPVAIPATEGVEKDIALRLYVHQVELELLRSALRDAPTRVSAPKSVLHRVRAMLATQEEEQFRRSVQDLRKRARAKLETIRLLKLPVNASPSTSPENVTLLELLQLSWVDLAADFGKAVWRREEIWARVFSQPPAPRKADGRRYLLELLAELAKRVEPTGGQKR